MTGVVFEIQIGALTFADSCQHIADMADQPVIAKGIRGQLLIHILFDQPQTAVDQTGSF